MSDKRPGQSTPPPLTKEKARIVARLLGLTKKP